MTRWPLLLRVQSGGPSSHDTCQQFPCWVETPEHGPPRPRGSRPSCLCPPCLTELPLSCWVLPNPSVQAPLPHDPPSCWLARGSAVAKSTGPSSQLHSELCDLGGLVLLCLSFPICKVGTSWALASVSFPGLAELCIKAGWPGPWHGEPSSAPAVRAASVLSSASCPLSLRRTPLSVLPCSLPMGPMGPVGRTLLIVSRLSILSSRSAVSSPRAVDQYRSVAC